MKQPKTTQKFIICIQNEGSEDLVRGKVYQVIPDKSAARDGLVRVVDESGEDYLYPNGYFAPITLPQAVKRALTLQVSLSN